jgi:hypothetical protein
MESTITIIGILTILIVVSVLIFKSKSKKSNPIPKNPNPVGGGQPLDKVVDSTDELINVDGIKPKDISTLEEGSDIPQ